MVEAFTTTPNVDSGGAWNGRSRFVRYKTPHESSWGDRFPSRPWSHPPVIGGVASISNADTMGAVTGPE